MPATIVKPASPRLRRGRSQLYGAWPLADHATPTADHVQGNALAFNGTNPPAWTAGPDGPALSFPGTSGNRLQTTGNVFDPSAGDFSAAIWFLANSWTTAPVLLGNTGTVTWLSVTTGGALKASYGLSIFSANGKVTVGAWHHAAMALQGTALTLYLDGLQVATGTSTRPATAANLFVGAASGGGNALSGLVGMAGVTLWQRALTAAEWLRLYADPYRIWTPRRRWAEYSYQAPIVGGGRVRIGSRLIRSAR